MPNFKTLNQDVVLSVGQTLSVRLTLEVGNITETVNVTAEAPILDTTSVSSGQNFDRALIEGLPMAANQPILLSKFAQGITGPTTQQLVLQGQIDGPNDGAGIPTGGVGSFNYTIDGATNAGNNRRMAASPNSDMIQEMRVETSNFDASQGHGTGANISLMTRAGTNATRGTFNYQYWTNQINSLNPQQKLTFEQRPETGEIYATRSLAQRRVHARRPGRSAEGRERPQQVVLLLQLPEELRRLRRAEHTDVTVPANAKHLDGDFSDLLTLGISRQYHDLRSADRASRSRAAGQLHPHAVPREHHPEGSVHERERHLQEPAVRSLPRHGFGAEPELRRAGADPDRQLVPGRRAEPDQRLELRRPRRLQRLGKRPLLLPLRRHDLPRAARRLDV